MQFSESIKISELRDNPKLIPNQMGVYKVLFKGDTPSFLKTGTGGFFKGKNPNVDLYELESNWITGEEVIYIGKAGGIGVKATLQSRLKQYLKFGEGKNVGHYGGRYIWQLKNSEDLEISWCVLNNEEPSEVESELIQDFRQRNGDRPFANLNK